MDLGFRSAVEDYIEPVVILQPLRSPVFIGCQGDLTHACPAFDLDEPDLYRSLRIFRMGFP